MKIRRKTVTYISGIALCTAFPAAPAFSQNDPTANAIGGIVGLFGAIGQAAARSNAQKKWDQVRQDVRTCVAITLSPRRIVMDQIIGAGIAPTDQRIAPIVNMCSAVIDTPLRNDFACTVKNSEGAEVETRCYESYAKTVNGSLVPISRQDVFDLAGRGEKVDSGNFEIDSARSARLQAEEQKAQAERQAQAEQAERERQIEQARADEERRRFLASPEGKKQLAAQRAEAAQALAFRRATWDDFSCVGSVTSSTTGRILQDSNGIKVTLNIKKSGGYFGITGWDRFTSGGDIFGRGSGVAISPENNSYGINLVNQYNGIIKAYFRHVSGNLSFDITFNKKSGLLNAKFISYFNNVRSNYVATCSLRK